MVDDVRIPLLVDLVEQCASPHGLTVEHVGLSPAGRRRALVIVVDTDISGLDPADTTSSVDAVDLDAVADLTREVSKRLDESDVMGETPYTLEVSSPGIGRPLERFEQFRRNVGRKLRLSYRPEEGAKATEVTGRLISASPEQLTITPDPVRHSPGAKPKALPDVTVTLADVTRANVEVDFAGADVVSADSEDTRDGSHDSSQNTTEENL